MRFIDKKLLTIIIALFLSIIVLSQLALMAIQAEVTESISDIYTKDIIDEYQRDLDTLMNIEKSFANNKIVQDFILDINNGKIPNKWDTSYITETENLLLEMGFHTTISLFSLKGEILFTEEGLSIGGSVTEEVWYDEMYQRLDASSTPIYINPDSGKITYSVISAIYDAHDDVIGIVAINQHIEDVLRSFQERFTIGHLDVYLEYDYGLIGTADIQKKLQTKDEFVKTYINTNDLEKITFVIDEHSIETNHFLIGSQINFTVAISLYALVISIIVLVTIKIILNPVVTSINKLKKIILGLGDDADYKLGVSYINDLTLIMETTITSRIKELLYYDSLTNLPNRLYFNRHLSKLIQNKKHFSLILLDVRNFKAINDGNIEGSGDTILIEIVQRLAEITKHLNRKIVRFGDDEFLIIIEGTYNENAIIQFYDKRIFNYFKENPISLHNKLITITFNSAAIIYPLHSDTKENLLDKLNIMLNKAKLLSRNKLLMFKSEVYQDSLRENIIKNILAFAIEQDEFFLTYQPIVDANQNIKKAEALIRWNSSTLGFVFPDQFIYITEQTGLIIELGFWILERAAKDIQDLYAANVHLQISINVSPIQIMSANFVDRLIEIFERYNIRYEGICLEITESTFLQNEELENGEIVANNLARIQDLGISIALDDFGTGYSSFNYLNDYHFNVLKLDKLFVNKSNDKQYEIINSLKNISDILGMEMIIEGVETQEQFDIVKQYGLIQGYYFSKPILWEELKKMLGIPSSLQQ